MEGGGRLNRGSSGGWDHEGVRINVTEDVAREWD